MTVVSVLILNVALSANPMFDNYKPAMLESLAYDDKLAQKAQSANQLRPAYCGSRYYRAVAGGGQCTIFFKMEAENSFFYYSSIHNI